MALLLAVAASYGAFLFFTSVAYGWSGLGVGPPSTSGGRRRRPDVAVWMTQAGLGGVRPTEFSAVIVVFAIVGAGIAFALFGGILPPVVAGAFAASFPVASYRARRDRRRGEAREAWPRMIEEMRLLTGSLGRSVPQALFDVGRRGPDELRPAFAAAQREWMISTDFARSVAVLKHGLADPTADATCETLLVAHEVGGNDLDRRLAALVEDRVEDLQGRKDAKAKQAGVRFARRFVLLVPLGMALAGLSIGNGKAAYSTSTGQIGVAFGLGMIAICWIWAGRLLKLPEEQRVFDGGGPAS